MNKDNYYNTIKSALEYYDLYQFKIINFLKKIEYIKITIINNLTPSINFYDINKNLLFESSYEIVGMYKQNNNIWKWGWSISHFNNNENSISRNILNYAINLDSGITNEIILKSEILDSKILIKNNLQLDIYLALSAYLTKIPFIFKFPYIIDDEDTDNNDKLISYKKLFLNKNYNNLQIIYIYIIDYKF